MRCKYCDSVLDEWEYVWNGELREWVEIGRHLHGNCVGGVVPEDMDVPLLTDDVEEESDG